MAEDQPDDAPKSEIDREIERLKQKRREPEQGASRGRFTGAGVAVAVIIFVISWLFWPAHPPQPPVPAPVVTPVQPAPPPTLPQPQYEEAIGPPYLVPVPPIVQGSKPGGIAKVAIVIDDCGISVAQTRPLFDLPKQVALAFLPYGYATQKMAEAAHARGHEIMLHMPMQPMGRNDPGPEAILTILTAEQIAERINNALSVVPYVIGVNNHMGSAATADAPAMQAVMNSLKGKNLFFLDSYTTSRSVAYQTALAAGLPVARRDVFLDDTVTPEAIEAQLARLDHVAHKQGYAIAIGHPHPATLEALKKYLPSLSGKGIKLVRITDLVRRP